MQLTTEATGDLAVVMLHGGYLDASNAEEFRREITPALEGNAKVILDMSEVRFLDSAGLGTLLSCLREVSAEGGDLKLCGLSRSVRSTFEVARMHRIFDIVATREEAIQAFSS